MRTSILTATIAVALCTTSVSVLAAPHAHHHASKPRVATAQSAAPAPDMAAMLAARDNEIAALRTDVANLVAKVDALEERTDAQSDINVATQKNVETLAAKGEKVDKLDKLVNDTTINGKAFVDVSAISQKNNGVKTNASGDGIDVKRFYLSVTHNFNDIWSANLTTDFNYVSSDGETNLFVKKVYLQGKFSDAAIFRAGSADMPWIPYVENFYGFRYVENTITDKLHFANSADWGLNLSGKVAGAVDYSVSAVNGGGYKNPTRSKRMDLEGRVGFSPFANAVIAVGAYSGTLGKETQSINAQHTADRVDFLAAYAKGNTRVGVEYFQAKNWNNVLTTANDKADGYSLWGSYGVTDTATLFARYDNAKPSKDLNPSLKDTYFNAGVEFLLRKGLRVAAVYKNDHLRDNGATNQKTEELGVFGEVAF
jgi:Skp family chaperone for outer membrane proteins